MAWGLTCLCGHGDHLDTTKEFAKIKTYQTKGTNRFITAWNVLLTTFPRKHKNLILTLRKVFTKSGPIHCIWEHTFYSISPEQKVVQLWKCDPPPLMRGHWTRLRWFHLSTTYGSGDTAKTNISLAVSLEQKVLETWNQVWRVQRPQIMGDGDYFQSSTTFCSGVKDFGRDRRGSDR